MHNRYPNSNDAVAAIFKAGTDTDCGGFMSGAAPGALAAGTITTEDIDVIMRRQFRMRIRLGHFDPPYVPSPHCPPPRLPLVPWSPSFPGPPGTHL